MKITVLNPVESYVSNSTARIIAPAISYQDTFWREGQRGMRPVNKTRQAWFLRQPDKSWFWTGLLPRIEAYLDEEKYQHFQEGSIPKLSYHKPYLPGITFRKDQVTLMRKALRIQRGVIQSPTGSGKTLLQLGLCNAFKGKKILILAHTIGIIEQTAQELKKFKFKNVQAIYGGAEPLTGDIVVSTMQSFVKVPVKERCQYFDVVICDESHHVSKSQGTYAKILSSLLAPVRLGFTATIPTNDESILAMEGLLGPVIGKLNIDEAVDLGILAKPKIRIVKVPKSAIWGSYDEVYDRGVINNRQRNKLIKKIVQEYIDQNKTILIMVHKLKHGNILKKLINCPFIEGVTHPARRERIKQDLIDKKIKCAICTTVWREGINIPSLDVVINAAGGKSEIMTLQAIGRGLRRTDDKETVTIVDFLDLSNNYLISHLGERLGIYSDNDWI